MIKSTIEINKKTKNINRISHLSAFHGINGLNQEFKSNTCIKIQE